MRQFRTIGLALVLSAAALSAAEKPVPSTPRTAVVLASPADVPGGGADRSSFDRALRLAVQSHLIGYLGYRGEQFDLLDAVARDDPAAAVSEAVTGRYSRALYVRVEGRETEEPTIRTDSHRRRYYTMARGCLEMSLTVVRLQPRGTAWRVNDSLTLNARSRLVPQADGHLGCEGFEAVVQRSIENALGPARSHENSPAASTQTLPTVLYLPRELRLDSTVTPSGLTAIVASASRSFAREFDTRLLIADTRTVPAGVGLGGDIRAGQRRLRRFLRSDSDTLRIAVNRQLTSDEHESGQARDEIGLSQLGRRLVLVNLVPREEPGDTVWYTLTNALTVLHEIGHTLGAIHVSDMNSVMTHYATWIGSPRFDPVNRQIVRAALDGRLTFEDPAGYLTFVSNVLTNTAYNLADYPAFFHEYLSYRGNRRLADTLRAAIGRKSYLWAADGYGLLMAGRKSEAARLFRKALREDPHQASLYFYLSEATEGAESAKARRTAARMGYLMADNEPERAGRVNVDIGRQ